MNVCRLGAHESSDQIERVCMNGSDVWHGVEVDQILVGHRPIGEWCGS